MTAKSKENNWEIWDFKENQAENDIYTCHHCSGRCFEVQVIKNSKTGRLKQLCSVCKEYEN